MLSQQQDKKVSDVAAQEIKVTSEIGDIVDSDMLYNQEENYQVPIITDWIWNVSYVMDGFIIRIIQIFINYIK